MPPPQKRVTITTSDPFGNEATIFLPSPTTAPGAVLSGSVLLEVSDPRWFRSFRATVALRARHEVRWSDVREGGRGMKEVVEVERWGCRGPRWCCLIGRGERREGWSLGRMVWRCCMGSW
mmetsp:Transcript_21264/g.56833  ORF Transcript_21264/g.56833 Transcript_21264/m.56833 type:complete len:120 (+) Transcript_21264:218-577(+)